VRHYWRSSWERLFDPIVWKRTKAFGHRYIPGIYLNDERFCGSAFTEQERNDLVRSICSDFGNTQEAAEHGMSARPYRSEHPDARFNNLLPDVWVDKPDEVFFEGVGSFISPNMQYGPVYDLKAVDRDMYTGQKGRHALCFVDGKTLSYLEDSDPKDLRVVYRLVERSFS
jgi:hypothetical protein